MTFLFTLSILSQGPTGKGVNALSGVIDPNYHEKEPELLLYKVLEIGLEVSLGRWFCTQETIYCNNHILRRARKLWVCTLRNEDLFHSSKQVTEGEGIPEQMVKKGDDRYVLQP